ncbi:MAG: TonB-dependent hemoglobin/transferrin/lactoferrin family receptor [Pseudomonadota bacterium]
MARLLLCSVCVFALSPAHAQEDPLDLGTLILNTAQRDTRSILDTPVAASVREGEALDSKQADTFGELIGDVPGVLIDGGPRGIAQEPNIRGFQDDQIVLRFDGGRQNFNQAHRGRFFVDPDIVQRVEVIRGGGSTLFGSGALGGVIAIETKDVDDLLDPGRDFGARIRGGYSSNGEIGSGSATLFGRFGDADALLFFGVRDANTDLEDGNGDPIRDSQLDIKNGLVKLGIEPSSDQRVELSFSHYEDEAVTPPNANVVSEDDNEVDRTAENQSWRLSWGYVPEGSDLIDLSVLVYGNELEIEEDRTRDGRLDNTTYDTIGIELTNRSRFDMGAPVTLVYGVEAFQDSQEGTRDGGDRLQFPDAEATTVGVFAEATIELSSQFDLIAGLRYDNYSRRPDGDGLDDVDEEFFSPRIGFSYRPTDQWQIFGNVARAFRAPSLTELYNDGEHFPFGVFPVGPGTLTSGSNVFIPNPDLDPEKSTQFELGARFSRLGVWSDDDRLTFSANAYYADVEDFIEAVVTAVDFTTLRPGAAPGTFVVDGTTRQRNVDARLWGFEAEMDYDAQRWFAGGGITVPRGETTDGDPLGSIPQDRLTAEFGLRPAPAWEIGTRGVFAAERNDIPEGGFPADAYTVFDVFASYIPTTGPLAGAEFRAGIDNLFDENYIIFPNGLSQAGQTFKFSVAATF